VLLEAAFHLTSGVTRQLFHLRRALGGGISPDFRGRPASYSTCAAPLVMEDHFFDRGWYK